MVSPVPVPAPITSNDNMLNQVADNVMSILKIQNSRTKTTYREMSANPNPNPASNISPTNPNANINANTNTNVSNINTTSSNLNRNKEIIHQHEYIERKQISTVANPSNNNKYETPSS